MPGRYVGACLLNLTRALQKSGWFCCLKYAYTAHCHCTGFFSSRL